MIYQNIQKNSISTEPQDFFFLKKCIIQNSVKRKTALLQNFIRSTAKMLKYSVIAFPAEASTTSVIEKAGAVGVGCDREADYERGRGQDGVEERPERGEVRAAAKGDPVRVRC